MGDGLYARILKLRGSSLTFGHGLITKEAALSRTVLRIRIILLVGLSAAALTYCSLLVPGRVSAVCSNLGTPVYCPVLGYGFPLPFVADSQAISPVGSVARDPLSLLIGEDDVLWPQLTLTASFWLLAVVLGRLVWLRTGWRRNRY
jgi:hypothetical protein